MALLGLKAAMIETGDAQFRLPSRTLIPALETLPTVCCTREGWKRLCLGRICADRLRLDYPTGEFVGSPKSGKAIFEVIV